MKLTTLLKGLDDLLIKGSRSEVVKGIVSHSKWAYPGALFIARRGGLLDGNDYIAEAVANGVKVVVTDLYNPAYQHITQVIYSCPEALETELLNRFYGKPFNDLLMFGVTGTNGKTSTASLLKSCLEKMQYPTGMMGTIANIIGTRRYPSLTTTPDKALGYKYLNEMVNEKLNACVMEVSSHALKQGRLGDIAFDVNIVTNLTQDHLDYHKTIEDYLNSKLQLMQQFKKQPKLKECAAVVNLDCPFAHAFIESSLEKVITYAVDTKADYQAINIMQSESGIRFTLIHNGLEMAVFAPLYGYFQVYNILASIAALDSAGFDKTKIIDALSIVDPIEGRLQRVCENETFCSGIFVDYAHTPDALKNALLSLRPLCKGRLILVFGCGGERDQQKRSLMGKVAINYADYSIITSDNPRGEDPYKIIQDIITDLKDDAPLVVESNRKMAIEKAISIAKKEDIILVAGKGHESIQDLGAIKLVFKDADIINTVCNARQEVKS